MIYPSPVLSENRWEVRDSQESTVVSPQDAPRSVEYLPEAVVHGAYLTPVNNYGEELLAFGDLVGKDIDSVICA